VQVAATLTSSPRAAALAAAWTRWSPRPDDPFSEQSAAAAARDYTAWMHACRSELGSSLLQPGRFLLPGEYAGAPMLQFVPWVWALPREKAAAGGTFAALAHRFEQYKQHVVRDFYQRHFSGFDRQIVLVDCLHALDAGPECFRDTERALARILESFAYGKGSLLSRLFRPRIDRLLFVASKADHVLPEQHPNLVSLLQHMIKGSRAVARFEGIGSECMALASVAATELARGKGPGGSVLAGLRGCALDGAALLVRPPVVPASPPGDAWWKEHTDRYDRFRPLPMDPARPMPHIRLDAALEFLLGDKLR
jgi:predicted YcjX-like family ATPase